MRACKFFWQNCSCCKNKLGRCSNKSEESLLQELQCKLQTYYLNIEQERYLTFYSNLEFYVQDRVTRNTVRTQHYIQNLNFMLKSEVVYLWIWLWRENPIVCFLHLQDHAYLIEWDVCFYYFGLLLMGNCYGSWLSLIWFIY